MRVLLVAAEPREFAGILARARESSPVKAAVDWARHARLGGHDLFLAANGAGRRRAAAALRAACQLYQPEAVVSIGFCGALEARLEVASLVVATEVASDTGVLPARVTSGGISSFCGTIWCSDRVIRTAAEKKILAETGASAVEMEAAGVAEAAQERGLPFYCVRAVTDLAGETMANDFQAALRPDGHFATMIILGSTLRDPSARIPELFRLKRRCDRAARALGDFFADCRF
jgi:adenosylhomocysteine nucleosidase